jgi:hypothetical protein
MLNLPAIYFLRATLKQYVSIRVVIIVIFSDHDPDTDRTITIVDRDLDQNKKLRSVSRSIMKFFGQFFDHAPISLSKSVTIERALTAQVSFFVFLSAKWLRKEIWKKLSLSIHLVSLQTLMRLHLQYLKLCFNTLGEFLKNQLVCRFLNAFCVPKVNLLPRRLTVVIFLVLT